MILDGLKRVIQHCGIDVKHALYDLGGNLAALQQQAQVMQVLLKTTATKPISGIQAPGRDTTISRNAFAHLFDICAHSVCQERKIVHIADFRSQ